MRGVANDKGPASSCADQAQVLFHHERIGFSRPVVGADGGVEQAVEPVQPKDMGDAPAGLARSNAQLPTAAMELLEEIERAFIEMFAPFRRFAQDLKSFDVSGLKLADQVVRRGRF